MMTKATSWRLVIIGACLIAGILSACAIPGPGYDGGYGYDYGDDSVDGFYVPYGYDYGGWGGRYRVGPPRGGSRGGEGRGGGGRSGGGRGGAPSIPSGHRGGGGHH
jgi:hypothetical protein